MGNEEVLLDDSRGYVERAVAADVDAKLDVWQGMPHGFLSGIGGFNAAALALDAIGDIPDGAADHQQELDRARTLNSAKAFHCLGNLVIIAGRRQSVLEH